MPSAFRIDGNLFVENREAGDRPGQRDRPRAELAKELRELRKELGGEPALAGSRALAWLADPEQSP